MKSVTAVQSNHSFIKFIVGVAAIVVMIAISALTVVHTNQSVSASNQTLVHSASQN